MKRLASPTKNWPSITISPLASCWPNLTVSVSFMCWPRTPHPRKDTPALPENFRFSSLSIDAIASDRTVMFRAKYAVIGMAGIRPAVGGFSPSERSVISWIASSASLLSGSTVV